MDALSASSRAVTSWGGSSSSCGTCAAATLALSYSNSTAQDSSSLEQGERVACMRV